MNHREIQEEDDPMKKQDLHHTSPQYQVIDDQFIRLNQHFVCENKGISKNVEFLCSLCAFLLSYIFFLSCSRLMAMLWHHYLMIWHTHCLLMVPHTIFSFSIQRLTGQKLCTVIITTTNKIGSSCPFHSFLLLVRALH